MKSLVNTLAGRFQDEGLSGFEALEIAEHLVREMGVEHATALVATDPDGDMSWRLAARVAWATLKYFFKK